MKTILLLGSLLLLTASAAADEVRLTDGRVLVGKVTERGAILEIETRDGIVRVDRSQVASRRTDEELRQELQGMARRLGDAPRAPLELAMQARSWGLEPELWHYLDAAVQRPEDAENDRRSASLHDFLAQLEPELLARRYRTACTQRRISELLRQHRSNHGDGQKAALLELLVREADADKDLRAHARCNSDPERRLLALAALLRRTTAGNDRFVWRTAILDENRGLRARALALAQAHDGAPGVVDYLAPGLMHGSAEVRVRTAEAFANLGRKEAIKLLVMAGPNAGKALAAADEGVRAHVAFINQQAYIRDFNVEVAQASFIADPQIGVLQSGTVLDVTVHGVFEQQVRIVRAYRSALQRLAGSDPGGRTGDWATWLARLASDQQAPPTGRNG